MNFRLTAEGLRKRLWEEGLEVREAEEEGWLHLLQVGVEAPHGPRVTSCTYT